MSDSPTAPLPEPTPAERLSLCWARGERPNPEDFLAGVGPLSPSELIAVLHVDQRLRWQAGDRVLVEDYLRRFPWLVDDSLPALEMVQTEVVLRRRAGEEPTL